MSEEGKAERREEKEAGEKQGRPVVPKKKRKTEPEVTIAPTAPGGPDVIVE